MAELWVKEVTDEKRQRVSMSEWTRRGENEQEGMHARTYQTMP